jgi:hypothetical protein
MQPSVANLEFSVAWCLSIPVYALSLQAMQHAETYFGRMLGNIIFMSVSCELWILKHLAS